MRLIKKVIAGLGLLFLALILISAILFYVVKHLKIKDIIEEHIERNLGIKVAINQIESSPSLTYIGAKGVVVYNPAGFQGGELARIKYIYYLIDPVNVLMHKKGEIYVCALDLERLNIIKDRSGRVNIKELIPIKGNAPADENSMFYFDMLVLSVGEVTYTDYTQSPPAKSSYAIGIKNAVFIGLKDSDEVVKMVIYKALENTAIGKLINLTVTPVFSDISDTVDGAWGTAKSGLKGVWGAATMPFKLIFN